ncbi:hypothetical protein ACCC68_02990 [Tenacibaculum maritimum]|uniref:hypothetical protein n=1 Tax=Tenacibaculum maritimum TaxID=107401 RepID=UPI003529FD44
MEAVSAFLQAYDTDYNLIAISNQTLAKLLVGKCKTFEELANYNFNPKKPIIRVLYKKVRNENRDQFIYIIETIFTNE